MTTNVLPVSNVITVTVTGTPSGLTVKNVNSLALFTQDAPINGEAYGIYISPSQATSNYGTNSKTAQMLNNIYSQLPNVLSGNGRVVIIPMLAAVSATHGNVQTANISANMAAIEAVNNGSIGLLIDGVAQQVSNLNFTGMTTWAQIAAYLDTAIYDADVIAIANGVQVGSHKVGTTSTVTLTAGNTGVNLDGAGYFSGATATSTAGVNSSGETIAACIARTSGLVGYVPIMSTLDLEDAACLAVAAAIQALDNMFIQHFASTQDIAGVITQITAASQNKMRCVLYSEGMSAANLMKAAYAGRGFSTDFTGKDTSTTLNLKSLTNVTPDTGISETLYIAAKTAGADIYVSYDGVPSILSTGANLFFDQVYSRLAYKFALQTAGFNYLRQTNTKIPQTEPGMTGLRDAYDVVNQQFVNCGYLAKGTWDSPETFGDPVIFNNNIESNGFYTFSQPIAQQSSVDRDDRVAPLVQIAAKEAGAIQSGNVLVIVNP